MAIRTSVELIEIIKTRIGDDNSDEAISLLEDVTDTLGEMGKGEDWKQKYEENDKAWREKYKARFNGEKPEEEEEESEEEKPPKAYAYEDLFKTKED